MNFSYEELYHGFGQYDTFIHVTLRAGSDSRKQYGESIGGTIIYSQQERDALEALFSSGDPIPRTQKNIRINVPFLSDLDRVLRNNIERTGFDCADIEIIHSYNKPRENRFVRQGVKEVPKLEVPINFSGWSIEDVHHVGHGIFNKRFNEGGFLAPFEISQFLAFREYLGEDNTISPYAELRAGREEDVEFYFCKTEFERLEFNGAVKLSDIDQAFLKQYADVVLSRWWKRKELIDAELVKSGEQIKTLLPKYDAKIQTLYTVCNSFEGEIYYANGKIIYLDFERFVHIYTRHVSETQIGENFQAKTIFQYKFDDIQYVIKSVISSLKDEIAEHFKVSGDKPFFRRNARSAYFDGHFYRILIEPDGRLVDFHPYNHNPS